MLRSTNEVRICLPNSICIVPWASHTQWYADIHMISQQNHNYTLLCDYLPSYPSFTHLLPIFYPSVGSSIRLPPWLRHGDMASTSSSVAPSPHRAWSKDTALQTRPAPALHWEAETSKGPLRMVVAFHVPRFSWNKWDFMSFMGNLWDIYWFNGNM